MLNNIIMIRMEVRSSKNMQDVNVQFLLMNLTGGCTFVMMGDTFSTCICDSVYACVLLF